MALAIGHSPRQSERYDKWRADTYEARKQAFERECAAGAAAAVKALLAADPDALNPEKNSRMARLRQQREERRGECLEAAVAHSAALQRQAEEQERIAEATAAIRAHFAEGG